MAVKADAHKGQPWGRVYAEQMTNPAWLALPPTAQALWFNALLECLAKESDGLVRESALALRLHATAPGADVERDTAMLVAEGWWSVEPEGFRMREWARWQVTHREAEALRRKRQAAGRKGGLARARHADE